MVPKPKKTEVVPEDIYEAELSTKVKEETEKQMLTFPPPSVDRGAIVLEAYQHKLRKEVALLDGDEARAEYWATIEAQTLAALQEV